MKCHLSVIKLSYNVASFAPSTGVSWPLRLAILTPLVGLLYYNKISSHLPWPHCPSHCIQWLLRDQLRGHWPEGIIYRDHWPIQEIVHNWLLWWAVRCNFAIGCGHAMKHCNDCPVIRLKIFLWEALKSSGFALCRGPDICQIYFKWYAVFSPRVYHLHSLHGLFERGHNRIPGYMPGIVVMTIIKIAVICWTGKIKSCWYTRHLWLSENRYLRHDQKWLRMFSVDSLYSKTSHSGRLWERWPQSTMQATVHCGKKDIMLDFKDYAVNRGRDTLKPESFVVM